MKNINSLKNSKEFREVYENGKSLANRLLIVYVLKKEGPFRLGITVSRKVGGSVVRHRVTRLIRESYISLKNEFPDGLWVVVIARPSCRECSQKEIENALLHMINRHGIKNDKKSNQQVNDKANMVL